MQLNVPSRTKEPLFKSTPKQGVPEKRFTKGKNETLQNKDEKVGKKQQLKILYFISDLFLTTKDDSVLGFETWINKVRFRYVLIIVCISAGRCLRVCVCVCESSLAVQRHYWPLVCSATPCCCCCS